ncbi:hypothetical protein MSAN_00668800 [Mycena sanguinolenta]|uniref:F-box domain-containing protein n=1 Tax=Mycena sanguinolenta TaxID=230812 RepID=A0A8H6Z198_9AGAR|nr:hypothetical protein MSAN_00668800 [Mycena sanguinolenta]
MDVGILRLPNEVLIQVFEVDPGNPGVFSISTLCRRLHYLALPIYLTAHGIPDPQTLLSQDLILPATQFHLLQPLRTALFIRSLKHISCSFPFRQVFFPSPRESRLYEFFHQVRRLTGFLANLERVDEVTLEFQVHYWFIAMDRSVAFENLNAWDATISPLLDVVLEKGCTALNVYGGIVVVEDFQLKHPPPRARGSILPPVVPLKQLSFLSAIGRQITGVFGIGQKAEVEGKTPLGLRTFNIHSSILLLAPCYGWTMATLRASSNLISLSIVCDKNIPDRDGDDILSNIHAPRLQYFFMDLKCRVTAPALERFFARHPHTSASESSFGTQVRLPPGMRSGTS